MSKKIVAGMLFWISCLFSVGSAQAGATLLLDFHLEWNGFYQQIKNNMEERELLGFRLYQNFEQCYFFWGDVKEGDVSFVTKLTEGEMGFFTLAAVFVNHDNSGFMESPHSAPYFFEVTASKRGGFTAVASDFQIKAYR
ncbi:MAG: hypothetical protein ABFQ53_01135 [Patescibacteria group bacterium]